MGKQWKQWQTLFFWGSRIPADGDCSCEIKRCLVPWKKSYYNSRQQMKKPRHYFADKCGFSQSYDFSSSQVWMWKLDHKESWVLKYWCFWTVVLEKTLENSLDCKESKPVNPKGNQSWTFIGRTEAKVEIPLLWPSDAKNWLFGKDSNTGKDWRQEEKGTTEDEMVGWLHWLNGHEFEQALRAGDGQENLACFMQSMSLQKVGYDWVSEVKWS